jgi:hypothetical protein
VNLLKRSSTAWSARADRDYGNTPTGLHEYIPEKDELFGASMFVSYTPTHIAVPGPISKRWSLRFNLRP